MLLYRVFPWLASAEPGTPGHALFVPPSRGAGRIDNPGYYDALYLSSAPAGAVAEIFGDLSVWTPEMLRKPQIPGSVRAVGTYELDESARVFDLDDPRALVELALRPSEVVTREREVTQRWALAIFQRRAWTGVRWWSYYDPRWYAYGLWDRGSLRVVDVQPLKLDSPAVVEAATVLMRPLRGS